MFIARAPAEVRRRRQDATAHAVAAPAEERGEAEENE